MGDEPAREGWTERSDAAPDSTPSGVELCDCSPIACFTFNRDAVILHVSLSGARMLGKERSRIAGSSFLALVRLDDPDAFLSHIRESHEAWLPVLGETTFSIGPARMEVHLVSVAVPNPHGAPAACHTAFVDRHRQRPAAEGGSLIGSGSD